MSDLSGACPASRFPSQARAARRSEAHYRSADRNCRGPGLGPLDFASFARTLVVFEGAEAPLIKLSTAMPLVKARIAVSSRDGGEIGCIEQRHFLRKWYFDLTSKDRRVGTITVESRRGWEFRIDDAQGVAAGRISKLMRGSVREVLAPTREYELSLNENASAELRALALAAAVCIHPTLSDEELDALLRTSD